MARTDYGAVSDAECIEGTRCPYCKAARGKPCVYATPDSRWHTEAQLRKWPSLRTAFKRAGHPTVRVHQHRRDIMRRRRWDAFHAAHRREVTPIPASYLDAWRAQLAFDQRENEALRRFFLAWGDMFESSTELDKPDDKV